MNPGRNNRGNWPDRIAAAIAGVAATVLLAMMVLTFVDVFGRYVLNRPLPGGFEVTQILLVLLIFAGLPLVTRREEHVQVTLLSDLLPATARRIQAAAVNMLIAGLLGVVAWRLWHVAERALSFGDTTSYLRIPMAPVVYAAAGLAAMAALLAAVNGISYLFGLRQRPSYSEGASPPNA
jgi:TRAP-type C4-dicarboxylate transport system permease small subunit